MKQMLVLLVLFVPACSAEELAVSEANGVRVEVTSEELIVTNGRDRDIFYFAVDERTATVIEWAPCVQVPTCPSVRAQSIERVPFAATATSNSTEPILFYWWHAITRDGVESWDSVRMIRIGR